MDECQYELRKAGVATPRTCALCGLGPCKKQQLVEEKALADPADEPQFCMQYSPWPQTLVNLVGRLEYRRWKFKLDDIDRGQGSRGLTLIITTRGYDSYNPDHGENYRVNHYMPVPPAAFNEKSWRWWLFEQCLKVERHECMEFFKIDGKRPYAPLHGPGNDPYMVAERSTNREIQTMYTGEVRGKEK
jgi:hypothetical protein